MEEVPANYLHWFWHNSNRDGDVAEYIRGRMSALMQENKDLIWEKLDRKPDAGYMPSHLDDGLYQVTTDRFVAGFVIRSGHIDYDECAPILWKNLKYWVAQCVWIGDIPSTIDNNDLFTELKRN